MNYAELHNHTYYSKLDGLSSPAEYCTRGKEVGIDWIACTDHGTLAGQREFQRACLDAGINPIIGVEAYISPTDRFDKRAKAKRQDGTNVYNHIILLAKNDQGIIDLNRLSDIAWNEGFYDSPRIDFEVLDQYGDNLIVLSGCMGGLVASNILKENYAEAEAWVQKFKNRFDDDFYMEIQAHNPLTLNNRLLDYAEKYQIKPVITGDCHFADPKDRVYEEVFLILGTNPKKLDNPDMTKANKMDLLDRLNYLYPDRRMSFEHLDLYLESPANRYKVLKDSGIDRTDVFTNTMEITEKIGDYTYRTNESTLPRFPDKDLDAEFRKICEEGLAFRGLAGKQEYVDRLNEELELIKEKGLAVYFYILWDVLKFCRRNDILYGMGRGSAAGSLACYASQITEVDPIKYNLLFWRFLDPSRSDMPDIDIDIQDDRRMEVKQYMIQKYGADRVAGVSNYTMYKGRSAIKAACRVLNVPVKSANKVLEVLGKYTDDEAAERNLTEYETLAELAEFREKWPLVAPIARKLVDRLNQYSIHAGGIVVADKPLYEYTAIESRKPGKSPVRQNVLSLNGDEAAALGLVKYDFLGLINLRVIANALKLIKKNHGRIIDWKHLREDDPAVFRMLADGHTVGVFQADAAASTQIIKELEVESFEDLMISNALVRPGAKKSFGKDFLARKKGHARVTFPTPSSKSFLNDTFGFALFQEQSMLVCTEIAKLTKETTNKIRKLTAKKKSKTELQPYREAFINGAKGEVGIKKATGLWEDIERTAEYSFNKCLAYDTKIDVTRVYKYDSAFTDEYQVTIGDLYNQMGDEFDYYVLGPKFVGKSRVGDPVWHRIKAVHNNGVQDIWRVYTNSRVYIDATWNHRHRLSKCWREAYWIHQNDQIMTIDGAKNVWKRTYAGQAETFDLELASEPHAFYANGFVTHNSHTVSYSKLSYVTAYLKYYYPAEFMTALLEAEDDIKNIPLYMNECARLGITVETPDVNESDVAYSCKGKKIYIGLSQIKGIGPAKAEHIIHNRPYASYADLVEKVKAKGSGLDIGMLGALNAVGATKFADHPIDDDEVKSNLYQYLGLPIFDTGRLTPDMMTRITPLSEFDIEGDVAVVSVVVTDIVIKNWIRVDLLDHTDALGIFVKPDHGLVKGHRYLMVLSGKNIISAMDLSEYDGYHPIVKYLRGECKPGTWAVAAKASKTQNGNDRATLVYSHGDQLKTATAWSNTMQVARQNFVLGHRVRIAIESNEKWGDTVVTVKRYE